VSESAAVDQYRDDGPLDRRAATGTVTGAAQAAAEAPPAAASADPVFVYALGRIEPQFPTLAVEKEFAQATGRADLTGLTDRETVHALLADPANRYLARQLCWVFTVEGLEMYLAYPRDSQDLSLLIDAVRPNPRATDVDVIIGVRGPIAPADACNGLMVPIVVFDQLYSFDVDGLLGSIPRPASIEEDRFAAAAEEVFSRMQKMADNAGATDEHRALNYLSVRSSAIYARAAQSFGDNAALDSVDVYPSTLSSTRKILDVVFSYRHRVNDVVDKYSVAVDVTEEFPFLVKGLEPYYRR
jgi:hypothetical protein